MSDSDRDSPTGTNGGLLRGIVRLAVITGAVVALAAVVAVVAIAYMLRDYKDDDDAVDSRPAGLRTVQEAALEMDSATAAKRPYPTVKQMTEGGAVDWRGMEVTVLSSDSRRRTYCITAVSVVDYLGEPVRYYIYRQAGSPPKPYPQGTTTPCT